MFPKNVKPISVLLALITPAGIKEGESQILVAPCQNGCCLNLVLPNPEGKPERMVMKIRIQDVAEFINPTSGMMN